MPGIGPQEVQNLYDMLEALQAAGRAQSTGQSLRRGMPGNFERVQRMANSMAEDAAIRESMKYSRRREEDEPEGTFTLAKYPGVEHEIWRVERGFGGQGYSTRTAFMKPEERRAFDARAKEWAQHQRKLLGMEEPGAQAEWARGGRGLSGRDRLNYFYGIGDR